MAHLILHDVDPEVMEELRRRADLRGRELEAEAKILLEDALGFSRTRALILARRIREGLAGRGLTGSAALLRAERDRR
jgi:plasmid stability protein